MGSANMQSGFRAKIRMRKVTINNPESASPTVTFSQWVRYACGRWSAEDSAPGLAADNTEGLAGSPGGTDAEGFQSRVPGIRGCRVSLTSVTYDTRSNWFGTPLSLKAGDYVQVEIYPAGINGKRLPFDGLRITRKQLEGEAAGLQPVTLEMESDGGYTFE